MPCLHLPSARGCLAEAKFSEAPSRSVVDGFGANVAAENSSARSSALTSNFRGLSSVDGAAHSAGRAMSASSFGHRGSAAIGDIGMGEGMDGRSPEYSEDAVRRRASSWYSATPVGTTEMRNDISTSRDAAARANVPLSAANEALAGASALLRSQSAASNSAHNVVNAPGPSASRGAADSP